MTDLNSIAASLAPQDAEIAFNLAVVLEACMYSPPISSYCHSHFPGGRLEEALEQYKHSKEYGVERASMHIRNVCAEFLMQLSLYLIEHS